MVSAMSALERMIGNYDRTMVRPDYRRYFEDSGYYNFGDWSSGATTQREACEALVDRLAGAVDGEPARLLDVACGPGGTTRRLTERFPASHVTGINVSAAQIEAARERAPRADFHCMNATRLEFSEAHFDAVFCVEAAFHFDTRDRFLSEALRVLRPGGALVLTDMLFRRGYRPLAEYGQIPRANLLPSLDEFRARLAAAGFTDVDVADATDPCLGGFRRHVAGWPRAERRAGRMSLGKSLCASGIAWLMASYLGAVGKAYLIATARKPVVL